MKWPQHRVVKWSQVPGRNRVNVGDMLVAGNTKVADLLCATPAPIPDGAHAMTHLVERDHFRHPSARHQTGDLS